MSETRKNRTRLARSSIARVFERGSLWASDDHLLVVSSRGYTERYRRIYYHDLQAVLVTDSPRRLVFSLILPLPAVALLALAFTWDNTVWRTAWGLAGAFFGLLFLINWIKGPSVKCHAQTPVQQVLLGALSRKRQAERFIAELAARVEAAQGRLEPAEAVAGLATPAEMPPPAADSPAPGARSRPAAVSPPPPRLHDERWHRYAFISLFAAGFLLALSFVWNHPFLLSLQILLVAGGGTLAIMALARGRDGGVPETLSFLTKISVGYVITLCGVVFAYYIALMVANPEYADDPLYFYRRLVSWRPGDEAMFTLLYLFSSAGALLTGGFGWWQCASPRPRVPPPVPPTPVSTAGNTGDLHTAPDASESNRDSGPRAP